MKALFYLAVAVTFHANATSFDCTKASTQVEVAICDNQSLGGLDDELAFYYAKLKESLDVNESKRLVREQRQWISSRNSRCENSTDRTSCLGKIYRDRVSSLKISNDLPMLPSHEELESICSELASLDSEERKHYGSGKSIADINNDGTDEIAETCWGGTMHAPCIEYSLNNGEVLMIDAINHDWSVYGTFGLHVFNRNGKVYRFHSYDDYFTQPAYLSYVTSNNNEYVVCKFDNKEVESFEPVEGIADAPEICDLLKNQDDSKITTVMLKESQDIPSAVLRDLGRYETGLARLGNLDYDNDGVPNLVGELEYTSGAGRGCDYNYFDELNPDKKSFTVSPERELLLEAQKVKLNGRHPHCGGMNNRFFRYRNKNYYEHNADTERQVLLIENNQIQQVCQVNKDFKTDIKSIGFVIQ